MPAPSHWNSSSACTTLGARGGFDAQRTSEASSFRAGSARIAKRRPCHAEGRAPILTLDETTSSLDSEVERRDPGKPYCLTESKTVIAIAHRFPTIAAIDRLIVMDTGRIVEKGTHDGLVARCVIDAQHRCRQSDDFLELEPAEAAE